MFELAKYEDNVCIRDTLTILGSVDGIATPVCGNMTSYASTLKQFETILFLQDMIQDIYNFHLNIIHKSTGVVMLVN